MTIATSSLPTSGFIRSGVCITTSLLRLRRPVPESLGRLREVYERDALYPHSLSGSGAHRRNGRDPAVDQEVCPDDVRRIVRREVNCQLRDFQRIRDPLAWIVGSEDALTRLARLFPWEATAHRHVLC